MVSALTWQKTPCLIESSRVEVHDSGDGDTYSVEMRYRYHYLGEEHIGDRYQLLKMSSSGRRNKERVVAQYPEGGEKFCWVNPRDPSASVIHRGPTFAMVFVLIPMVFVVIGGGGLAGLYGWLPAKWSSPGRQAWRPKESSKGHDLGGRALREQHTLRHAGNAVRLQGHLDGATTSREIRFAPKSRWPQILMLGLFAVVFGGATGLLFIEDGSGLLWFLRISFSLAVLILVAGFVQSILSLANPKVILWLEPGSPTLGVEVAVRFQIDGRLQMFERLTIRLEGVEQARYQQGTDTVTDEHVFLDLPLTEMSRGMLQSRGICSTVLPTDSMPSFKAKNNSIQWRLKADGEIAKWPDVAEQHEFLVDSEVVSEPGGGQVSAETPAGYPPGGTFDQTISWNFEEDPERIELRLVWYTMGKGDQDLSVVDQQEIERPHRQGTQRVQFDLPDGPFSYTGRLLQIAWALDIIAFPSQESQRIDFVMGPLGLEVRS